MAKKRALPNGRLLWGGGGSRLWDRAGDEWQPTGDELDRVEAQHAVERPDVQVAMSVGTAPLRWLDGPARLDAWRNEILPNFHDVPGWKPPPGSPGQKPLHATVWKRGETELILITDLD